MRKNTRNEGLNRNCKKIYNNFFFFKTGRILKNVICGECNKAISYLPKNNFTGNDSSLLLVKSSQ